MDIKSSFMYRHNKYLQKVSDNPGSLRPHKIKSIYSILTSFLILIKNEKFNEGAKYIITGILNFINHQKILDKSGKNNCPLCKQNNNQFIHSSNHLQFAFFSICPWCSSRSRHRGLYFLYNQLFTNLMKKIKILHFAPELVFLEFFKNNDKITYHTTDLNSVDVDYPGVDIQNIKMADETYDYILCNHVLEHIKEDSLGLQEIHRLLKYDGYAIITVPGDFRRYKTINYKSISPNGHYRDYGYDLLMKLRRYFNTVLYLDLSKFDKKSMHGIRNYELVFILRKTI